MRVSVELLYTLSITRDIKEMRRHRFPPLRGVREDGGSRRTKHRSSSGSLLDDRANKLLQERIKVLESVVEILSSRAASQLAQPPRVLQRVDIRQEDEELLPLFDPSEDDADVERWIEQVDDTAGTNGPY